MTCFVAGKKRLYDPSKSPLFIPRVTFLLKFRLFVAVNEEKQASSQEKSDESTIVSVVKELMPSLENRYTSVSIGFRFGIEVSCYLVSTRIWNL